MRRSEAIELIRGGEDSKVELKRDEVPNHELAKELVAFLNLAGGTVFLGVEDDGSISGIRRPDVEERVVELARVKVDPPIVPVLSWLRDLEPGRKVLAVRVPQGPDKPYARVHNHRRTYFVRVGSSSREASREELERMFQASGRVQYGLKPVPGTSWKDLDRGRLVNYLTQVLKDEAPAEDDDEEWRRQLRSLDLLIETDGLVSATVDGQLLFGLRPGRFLPHSGVRAASPTASPSRA